MLQWQNVQKHDLEKWSPEQALNKKDFKDDTNDRVVIEVIIYLRFCFVFSFVDNVQSPRLFCVFKFTAFCLGRLLRSRAERSLKSARLEILERVLEMLPVWEGFPATLASSSYHITSLCDKIELATVMIIILISQKSFCHPKWEKYEKIFMKLPFSFPACLTIFIITAYLLFDQMPSVCSKRHWHDFKEGNPGR